MKMPGSFALVLIVTGAISVQTPPDTLWTKIFGGTNQGGCNNAGDVGRAVERTDDEGFVISGWTNSFGKDNTDVWMVGIDAEGNEIWSSAVTVNDTTDEAVYDMNKTRDGGFILTGFTEIIYCSGGHGRQFACGGKALLLRVNELGDTLWTRTYEYGDAGWTEGRAVSQISEGGFVLVGRTDTEENGPDLWMCLTDGNGDVIWTKIISNPGYDEGLSVQQTDDGGFIVTGRTESIEEQTQKLWLIRTNELGDVLWMNTYLKANMSEGRAVLQTADGGFVLAGAAESWGDEVTAKTLTPPTLNKYLNAVSAENKILYRPNLPITSNRADLINIYSEIRRELFAAENPGFGRDQYYSILVHNKIIEGRDAWVVRTNELGDILWEQVIGGPDWDDVYALSPTNDNGFILAGEKHVRETDSQDIWLIRLSDAGEILWSTTVGDSSYEVAYDVKQTSDNGYIVTALKENREFGVDQTWLLRFGEDINNVEQQPEKLVQEFTLEQNYPNPFNSITKICYTLAATSTIKLKIYDVLGREIKVLVDEQQSPGYKSVTWDGTDQSGQTVNSGIYLYKLETGQEVQFRKMVFIK